MQKTKVKVMSYSISADGFGAGPDQSLEQPMGANGHDVHKWLLGTEYFQKMMGKTGGSKGVDDKFANMGFENIGAWILGRNMFGPVRGPWPDLNWRGWWGDEPPYHVPVFVLTHHPRETLKMAGDTTFYFETEGPEVALERAVVAAKGRDIRVGGGVKTIHQYLKARLIDELHIAVSPVFLGKGESFWQGIDLRELGYSISEQVAGEQANHLIIKKI